MNETRLPDGKFSFSNVLVRNCLTLYLNYLGFSHQEFVYFEYMEKQRKKLLKTSIPYWK